MILCLDNELVCLSLDLGEADLEWKECTPQNTRLLLNSVKQLCLSPGTISPDKHTAQVLHKGSQGIGVFVVAVIGRYRWLTYRSLRSRCVRHTAERRALARLERQSTPAETASEASSLPLH